MSIAKCKVCDKFIEHASFVMCDECWNEQFDLAIVRPVVDPRAIARKLMDDDKLEGNNDGT